MPFVDVANLLQPYEGLWVALTEGNQPQVVGSGTTLKEAKEVAIGKGFLSPIYTKVPESAGTYIL